MSLFFILASANSKGAFLLDLANDMFRSTDEDGFSQSGSLVVAADGEVSYVGDAQGTNETGHTWWSPIGSAISGTWHVKINHLTGVNRLSAGDAEDVWHALSSDRTFTVSRASVGGPDIDTSTYDLAFSDDAGSTVHANVTVTIELEENSP